MSTEPPDTVVTLPVAFKDAVGQPTLVPVDPSACQHLRVTYEVDVRAGKCRCKACGGEVNPIFVLQQLMHEESKWRRERTAYTDEMRRLGERSSTKCQHCGKMTRISHR